MYRHNSNIKSELVLQILANKHKRISKYEVLEIGCGIGIEARHICNFFGNYLAIDNNQLAVESAKGMTCQYYANLTFKVLDIECDDFKKFNLILSYNTAHLLKFNVIDRIVKLLKSGGLFIVIEPPIKPENWGNDHYNISSLNYDEHKWNLKRTELLQMHEYLLGLKHCDLTEYNGIRIYTIY